MTHATSAQDIYEQWLGLLPQFFAQFGAQPATLPADNGGGAALPFPADQIASAAAMTQRGLQSLAQSYAPLLKGAGAPALLAQWAAALPMMGVALPSAGGGGSATTAFAPWLTGGAAETYVTAFERTFGALSDALGFGPVRKLQAAITNLVKAQTVQNDSRAAYAMLVHSALASGWDEHIRRLAAMAERGERVDSMLALMRMWASATEDAVHRVLQSEPGLEATAAVTRAGLAHRKQLQAVAAIVADGLDMATRRDLDEAFREIQQLKRELRATRSRAVRAKEQAARPTARAKRRTKGATKK